jgi:hypothetical protein
MEPVGGLTADIQLLQVFKVYLVATMAVAEEALMVQVQVAYQVLALLVRCE